MFHKAMLALVLLTTAGPVFADSRPHSAAAHMRPQLFHDRAPHVHNREAQVKRHGA